MYEKFKHNNIFKFFLISTAVFEIPLTSQYYGWASLVYVFKSEGYFTDIEACQNFQNLSLSSSNSSNFEPENANTKCEDARNAIFSSLYQTADNTQFATMLIAGILIDKYGTRISRNCFTLFIILGSLLGWLCLTPNYVSFLKNQWISYLVMGFLGLGAVPLFITNQQLGYTSLKFYETIISFNNGMFSVGEGVTIIPKLLHQKNPDKFGMNQWFLVVLVSCLLVLVRTYFFMPRQFVNKEEFGFGDEEQEEDSQENGKGEEIRQIPMETIYKWIFMKEFLIFIPVLTSMILTLAFIHQNLNAWLQEVAPDKVSEYTNLFAYLQPVAIIASFAAGGLLNAIQNFYSARKNNNQKNVSKIRIQRYGLSKFILVIYLGFSITLILMSMIEKSIFNITSSSVNITILFIIYIFTKTGYFCLLDILILTEFPVNAYGRVIGSFPLIWAVLAFLNIPLLKLAQTTRNSGFFMSGFTAVLVIYQILNSVFCYLAVKNYDQNRRKYPGLIFQTGDEEIDA